MVDEHRESRDVDVGSNISRSPRIHAATPSGMRMTTTAALASTRTVVLPAAAGSPISTELAPTLPAALDGAGCADVPFRSGSVVPSAGRVDGDRTRVLVEQMGAVDVTRLGGLAGHLTPAEMWGVDLALETVLDLS